MLSGVGAGLDKIFNIGAGLGIPSVLLGQREMGSATSKNNLLYAE
jgi:hypothetical protein